MNSGPQVYIITGANRGYGLAIAKTLVAEIAEPNQLHLILVGRVSASLAAVATELQGTATTHVVDSVDFSCMDKLDHNIERIFDVYQVSSINKRSSYHF
jgi:NADP-dependent 3-hydroxy acid dehydrogenase YdfG